MLKKLTGKKSERKNLRERTPSFDICVIECRIVCDHEPISRSQVTSSLRYPQP
jgi:hypothetical protein